MIASGLCALIGLVAIAFQLGAIGWALLGAAVVVAMVRRPQQKVTRSSTAPRDDVPHE